MDEHRLERAPRLRQVGRRLAGAVAVVAVIGALVIASATTMGKNGSSKFSSVASAICDTRLEPAGGRLPVAAIRPPIAVVAVGGDAAEHESACGGGVGGGGGGALAAPSVTVTPPAPSTPSAPAPPAVNVAAGQDAPSSTVPVLSMGPAAAGHSFISTATMTVKVEGADVVNTKKEDAIRVVEGSGGGLFGEQTSFNGDAHATVTFKVPPEKFRPLLSELAGLGTLEQQEVKTDDVTQQVIDLDARITVAQEGLDRMRGLLSKASDLNQVATLEADVGRRQTELEQLKGEQQTLGQRVALATIVLTLTTSSTPPDATTGPGASGPASGSAGGSVTTTTVPKAAKPLPGFSDGLENGWHVFTVGGTVLLACLGALLPFFPVLVISVVPWLVVRRRRARRDVRPAAMPAS